MSDSILLVAVGASAGGLEALTALFAAAPERTGMSFVVVQHLSPDYKSMMVELLDRRTSLTVKEVEDGIVPEAEHVYVIEPQTSLRLEGDQLRIDPMPRDQRVPHPINIFFESVAAEREGACAAVVLSGTGSDGARGVEAIKDAGGTVVVQDPETASFDGMPKAAIQTGTADLVLPPSDVIKELKVLQQSGPASYFGLAGDHGATTLGQIVGVLRKSTGVNFGHYKPTTVIRRIHRRMEILDVADPRQYVELLRNDAVEIATLYRDLLIGVTRFHRDTGAVTALQTIALPALLERPSTGPVRAWVAGCSTGEEAYTVAMLLAELLRDKSREFRVFATDVDAGALEAASAGEFDESSVQHLPTELLERYFERRGATWVARPSLRDKILFSRHNVIEDPPFTRLDFISCRNLLIYLRGPIQQRILQIFSSSLNENGVLWLGSSEALGASAPLYDVLDPRWRIYGARPGRRKQIVAPLSRTLPAAVRVSPHDTRQTRLLRAVRRALTRYAPPTVIINAEFEVVYRYGELGDLLSVPSGEVSLDIREMLPTAVSSLVVTGVHRVLDVDEDVVYSHVQLETPANALTFDLRLRSASEAADGPRLVALIFENMVEDDPVEEIVVPAGERVSEIDAQLHRTRRELADTRANLQTTIEELESSNEELQSTNEELIASNEELQSTNEELQSVNEELRMVNDEHQVKVAELMSLNHTLDTVLNSVEVGILLVDSDLQLARFNPAAARYVNLRPVDIGRPLSHLTHHLDFPDLLDRIGEVVRDSVVVERHVAARDGEVSTLVGIRPRRLDDYVSGALVTITDVTTLLQARHDANRLKAAFDQSGASVCIIDPKLRIQGYSSRFLEACGRDGAYLEDTAITELVAQEEEARVRGAIEQALAGARWSGVVRVRHPSGAFRWDSVDLVPGQDSDERYALWLATDLRDALRLGLHSDGPAGYWLWNPDTHEAHASSNFAGLWELSEEPRSLVDLEACLNAPDAERLRKEVGQALSRTRMVRLRLSLAAGEHDLEVLLQRSAVRREATFLVMEARRVSPGEVAS